MSNTTEFFTITNEVIDKADTYMPIELKIALSQEIAKQCIVDLPTAQQNIEGNKFLSLPTLKGENKEIKEMCLLYTLLTKYLKIQVKEPFDEKEYNYYASGAILNQLERYKSNFDLKNKVFDLIYDYKEFRKMVDKNVENIILANNDSLGRLTASIQLFSTPENIQKMKEELEKINIKSLQEKKESKTPKKSAVKAEKVE